MRYGVVVILAGCGFTAPSGQQQPIDASTTIDAPDPSGGDAPMIDGPSGPQCPAGYGAIATLNGSSSKYRFVSTAASWGAAEQDCENDGNMANKPTHLIVLDDATEKTAMITGLTGGAPINDQWVGVTDLVNEGNAWMWVTNQPTTLQVSPSGNADDKDCVRVKDTGVEEARDCTETNKYVCECDALSAASQRFPNLPNGNGGGGGGGGGP